MKNFLILLLACTITLSSCKKEEKEFLTQGEQNAKEIERLISDNGINNIVVVYGVLNPNGVYYYKIFANSNLQDHYYRGALICGKNDCFDLSNLIKTEIFNDRNPYRGTKTLEIHLKL